MLVVLDCRMAAWSGVGRYTTGLARALGARGDVELVQVCAVGETPPVAPGAGAGVVWTTASPLGVRGARELGRLVREIAPDVVHCPHFPTPVPVRAPLVVTLHDLIPLLMPDVMPSVVRRRVYRWWNVRAARVADRLVAPSRATADDVERLLPDSRGKVTVIAEGVDDFLLGPDGAPRGAGEEPAGAPDPLSPACGRPYLLSMGNTKPHKDLPTLLQAFALLAAERPGLHLVLAGAEVARYLDGVLAGAPPEVRARVAFTGPVTDAGLRGLYAGAAAFVFPSRQEGFGLPPLEAMACGAPVVCAEAASLPEVVGDAALLFPAGDVAGLAAALSRVLDDPGLRGRLVRAGHERAARYTWARAAEATVGAYGEALRHFAARRGGGAARRLGEAAPRSGGTAPRSGGAARRSGGGGA